MRCSLLLVAAVASVLLFAVVAAAKPAGSASAGAAIKSLTCPAPWRFEAGVSAHPGLWNDKQVASPDSWVLYKQCGESWSNDRLGTSSGTTICDAGCAMSCVAMILRTKGTDVNPGSLNSWLVSHGGYEGGDELVWGAVDAFGTAKMIDYYHGAGSLSSASLADLVGQGRGVVVNVRDGGHWVLVTAKADGDNFAVNDPGFPINEYAYSGMSNFVVYS